MLEFFEWVAKRANREDGWVSVVSFIFLCFCSICILFIGLTVVVVLCAFIGWWLLLLIPSGLLFVLIKEYRKDSK